MKKPYMLLEFVGDGPLFDDGENAWLVPYDTWPSRLQELFDSIESREQAVNIRFTTFDFTDEEFDNYGQEHNIALGG